MRVLMPLPARDFDPTESAVPWRVLLDRRHEVVFATPDGKPAQADPRMLTGEGLGPWRRVLAADRSAAALYGEMSAREAFTKPLAWSELDVSASTSPPAFDAVVLPGGHAPGMRPYLESEVVQKLVARMLVDDKPVGAICHGVLVLARARINGVSALEGRTVTALLAAQERLAHNLTRVWLGDYYRTYRDTTVQAEVTRAVGASGRFVEGPPALRRDRPDKLERGFSVIDKKLVTARWPGDAWRFATDFAALLGRATVET